LNGNPDPNPAYWNATNPDPDLEPDLDPIRIQSGSRDFMTKNLGRFLAGIFYYFFCFTVFLLKRFIKTTMYPSGLKVEAGAPEPQT
jgi:hypothetical protein